MDDKQKRFSRRLAQTLQKVIDDKNRETFTVTVEPSVNVDKLIIEHDGVSLKFKKWKSKSRLMKRDYSSWEFYPTEESRVAMDNLLYVNELENVLITDLLETILHGVKSMDEAMDLVNSVWEKVK